MTVDKTVLIIILFRLVSTFHVTYSKMLLSLKVLYQCSISLGLMMDKNRGNRTRYTFFFIPPGTKITHNATSPLKVQSEVSADLPTLPFSQFSSIFKGHLPVPFYFVVSLGNSLNLHGPQTLLCIIMIRRTISFVFSLMDKLTL